MLSVIIPTNNSEGRVNKLLESLEKIDKGIDLEFVLVDDASNDSTPLILDNFSRTMEERTKVIKLTESRGICGAMNEGIKACSGSSITFLNPNDDIYISEFEEVARMALKKDSKTKVFVSDFAVLDPDTNTPTVSKNVLLDGIHSTKMIETEREYANISPLIWRIWVKKSIARLFPFCEDSNSPSLSVLPLWLGYSNENMYVNIKTCKHHVFDRLTSPFKSVKAYFNNEVKAMEYVIEMLTLHNDKIANMCIASSLIGRHVLRYIIFNYRANGKYEYMVKKWIELLYKADGLAGKVFWANKTELMTWKMYQKFWGRPILWMRAHLKHL